MEFQQLPLLINAIDDITFDKLERNVFYAVGTKNANFEPENTSRDQINGVSDHVRIEKFFIEADSFSSKTQAFLQLKDKEENIMMYSIS